MCRKRYFFLFCWYKNEISWKFLNILDLRWGVTSSQNEQAATLLMCLREIERCNLFLGCYGERYGWCLSQTRYSHYSQRSHIFPSHRNPTNNDELLKRTIDVAAKEFPWIENYRDRSVTEIEMRMVKKLMSLSRFEPIGLGSRIQRRRQICMVFLT